MVYRPLAITARQIDSIVRYCDKSYIRPFTSTNEIRYRLKNYKYHHFDTISYRTFFYEYNWDVVEKRKLHKYVRLKIGKFLKKKYLSTRDFPTRSEWTRRKQQCLMAITEMMMYDMFEDMVKNDNKLIISSNFKGQVNGWYKLGVFKEKQLFNLKDRLILAIVPHKEERVSKFYPVIVHSKSTWDRLNTEFVNPNKVEHEDIDIQECLAANNRLSGICRRVKQSAPH